jgi:phosphoribosyl-ATP pyrophosphohydrolase/phosphoribosyl-AMP cyclohydrolase
MMGGADWNTLERVIGTASLPVTYAGGVASLDEVRRLSAMGADIQVGMALYTGKIGLAEAFVASLNWRGESLIPVVTTDGVGRVLMMAYASKESIMRSFLTGYMWYFSRSRQRLWQKGESSGNVQKLIQLRADCDRDTVRAMVDPQGPSCHLGHDTCFGSLGFTLEQLQRVVEKRLAQPDSRSYTASLNRSEVRNKLMEEAGEVVEATDRDEVIWEAADLLYFLTVLISKEGIEYGEVWNELWRRRWLKGSAGGVNGKGEKDETNRQR